MSRHKRWLLSLLGTLLAANAVAQTSISHTGLIEADYSQARQSGVQETDTGTVLATVFLAEVNHGSLPHSQAAFLERASSLTMAWADLDADFGAEGEVYTLGLTHYITRFFALGSVFSQDRPEQQQHINTVTVFARMLF